MNGLSAPSKTAKTIAHIGGRLLRPFRRDPKAKTDAELQEFVQGHDLLGQLGVLLVAFGLAMEFVVALDFRHGKSFVEAWYPVIGTGLIGYGVIVELVSHRSSKAYEKELERRSAERVAAAEERAAAANERAAKAELALQKYKAPRDLLDEQVAKLSADMKRFAGQTYSLVSYTPQECTTIASQIKGALNAAGWHDLAGWQTTVIERQGIRIECRSAAPQETMNAVGALMFGLQDAGVEAAGLGLPAWGHAEDDINPNIIKISVGTKN